MPEELLSKGKEANGFRQTYLLPFKVVYSAACFSQKNASKDTERMKS